MPSQYSPIGRPKESNTAVSISIVIALIATVLSTISLLQHASLGYMVNDLDASTQILMETPFTNGFTTSHITPNDHTIKVTIESHLITDTTIPAKVSVMFADDTDVIPQPPPDITKHTCEGHYTHGHIDTTNSLIFYCKSNANTFHRLTLSFLSDWLVVAWEEVDAWWYATT